MVDNLNFADLRMANFLPPEEIETVANYELEEDWGFDGVTWVGESFRDTCFFLRPADDPDTLRLVILDTTDFPDEAADRFLHEIGLPIVLNLTWAEVRAALGKPIRRPRVDTIRDPRRVARFAAGGLELYLEVSDDWGIMYLMVLAPFGGLTIRDPNED
jgi:hypothetical protein